MKITTTSCLLRKQRGIALIIAMVILMVLSSLMIAMFTMSSGNSNSAVNLHQVNNARNSAESGLEMIRYYVNQMTIPGSVAKTQRFAYLANTLEAIGDASFVYDVDDSSISFGSENNPILLNYGQTFYAELTPGTDGVNIRITGQSGNIKRTISSGFGFDSQRSPIFDFGLATKGPLQVNGNPNFTGANSSDEAEIYIESMGDNRAIEVSGNLNFDGAINITNPDAYVVFDGDVNIAGESGSAAMDHVFIGTDAAEFPLPDTDHFRQYATGGVISSSTDTSDNMTLTNTRITADSDPCFDGNITIKGVLFIESPNKVEFKGNVNVQGVIIGDGDAYNPGSNEITYYGNFQSNAFPSDSSFDVMRHEQGAAMLVPGFNTVFEGNFSSVNGVMAVSGAYFKGNIEDTKINGSILNYSDNPMVIEGNPEMEFNLSSLSENPAGFTSDVLVVYDPTGYDEVL